MKHLIIPKGYRSHGDVLKIQRYIKEIKDFFEARLAEEMSLTRVSAPLFVREDSGINDNLSGTEEPVSFRVKTKIGAQVEIVQSLAKWKRIALKRYGVSQGSGIYTDMNAIRPCEICDNTHSFYVDQWDWEKVIGEKERNRDFLEAQVKKLYRVFLDTDTMLQEKDPKRKPLLPETITFFTTEELLSMYPEKTPEERERAVAKEYGAVFIEGIGHRLSDGKPHGSRSPDYDDWRFNGDIIFWNPILDDALELSSMGIRVNAESLEEQLRLSNTTERRTLYYHQLLLEEKLPLTIGGGIGQSRICMFFLQRAHIGEVQASLWPEEMRRELKEAGIHLL